MKFYQLAAAATLMVASSDAARLHTMHKHEVELEAKQRAEMEAWLDQMEDANGFFGDMINKGKNLFHSIFHH